MAAVRHVLIVGGGIAGMTLAAALQRRGIAADVIEKAPGWDSIGAGIAVQPNGMRALRTAGLDDLVVSAGRVLERWWFRSSAGGPGPFLSGPLDVVSRARKRQAAATPSVTRALSSSGVSHSESGVSRTRKPEVIRKLRAQMACSRASSTRSLPPLRCPRRRSRLARPPLRLAAPAAPHRAPQAHARTRPHARGRRLDTRSGSPARFRT